MIAAGFHCLTQFFNHTSLALIIAKHLVDFPFIIAGNTIRQNMNGITRFAHIVASGFHASYGIGSRNLARYNTDLSQIRDAIKQLEKEIANLEGALNGQKPRKAVGVVPRDW